MKPSAGPTEEDFLKYHAILGVKHKEKEPVQIMGISKLYIQSSSPALVDQVQYKPANPNSPHECGTDHTPSASLLSLAKTSHNKAQYEYELSLHEEHTGQGNFEQLATRSNKRLGVPQENFGLDFDAMKAAAKKLEAMETDIYTDEERSQPVVTVTKAIETNKYHNTERTNARNNILKIKKTQIVGRHVVYI